MSTTKVKQHSLRSKARSLGCSLVPPGEQLGKESHRPGLEHQNEEETSCVHRRQDDHSLTMSETEWLRRHLFFFWLNDLNIYKECSNEARQCNAQFHGTKKKGDFGQTHFQKHPDGLACGLITC